MNTIKQAAAKRGDEIRKMSKADISALRKEAFRSLFKHSARIYANPFFDPGYLRKLVPAMYYAALEGTKSFEEFARKAGTHYERLVQQARGSLKDAREVFDRVKKQADAKAGVGNATEDALGNLWKRYGDLAQKILQKSPKLSKAGLTADDIVRVARNIMDDVGLKRIMGNHKFSDWLRELEKLSIKPENLKKVVEGLKKTDKKFLQGELFRLRQCQDIGWGDIKNLEKGLGIVKKYKDDVTGKWNKTRERFSDIVKASDKMHIEVKHYTVAFDKLQVKDVNKFLVQMEKDIRLIKDSPFEYHFAKTKAFKTEADLHKQIKHILEDGKFANIDPKTGNSILEKVVGNGKPYEFIDDFIKDKFKVIDLE